MAKKRTMIYVEEEFFLRRQRCGYTWQAIVGIGLRQAESREGQAALGRPPLDITQPLRRQAIGRQPGTAAFGNAPRQQAAPGDDWFDTPAQGTQSAGNSPGNSPGNDELLY